MPTIRQIAKVAQVSPMTVSFVLNNKPGQVSEETRDRVLQVVREMGYRPRAAAPTPPHLGGPTVGERVLTFGVASGTDSGTGGLGGVGYGPQILNGLLLAADRQGQNLTFFATSLFRADPAQSIRTFCDGRCDGIFVLAPGPNNRLAYALRERGFPCVLIGDRGDEPTASVDLDNVGEARRLTEFLIGLGHRRIGFVGFPGRFVRSAQERQQGFEDALRTRGLPVRPDWVLADAWKDPQIFERVLELGRRARPDRPTAFVCWNDTVAASTMVVLGDAGLRVPSDVSVVGFDDDPIAAAAHPQLTTIRQPYQEIASVAVGLLRDQIEARPTDRDARRVLLSGELIVRGSVGPPREEAGRAATGGPTRAVAANSK